MFNIGHNVRLSVRKVRLIILLVNTEHGRTEDSQLQPDLLVSIWKVLTKYLHKNLLKSIFVKQRKLLSPISK